MPETGSELSGVSGVILSRVFRAERSVYLQIFLRDYGITFAFVRLSESGQSHFGGDIEPLTWGVFKFGKNITGKYRLLDVENQDDMLQVRKRGDALVTAVSWANLVLKYLSENQPDDPLLVKLYWNMHLLKFPEIPVEAVNFRFLWQWLTLWGLAPELERFFVRKKFDVREISLLKYVVALKYENLLRLFRGENLSRVSQSESFRNIFTRAADFSRPFFREK